MSKVSNILTNLFSRSTKSTSLHTDAAPLPARPNDTIKYESQTSSSSVHSMPESIAAMSMSNTTASSVDVDSDSGDERERPPRQQPNSYSYQPVAVVAHPPPSPPLDRSSQTNALISNNHAVNVFQISNASGVHIGSSINYNITASAATSDTEPKTRKVYRKTKTLKAMLVSDEPLEHATMDLISTHLGEGWRNLFRDLGYSDGQLEQAWEDNYVKGVKEVIYQLLLDWTRNETSPSLGRICDAMWKAGHLEAVTIVKDYWKTTFNAKMV